MSSYLVLGLPFIPQLYKISFIKCSPRLMSLIGSTNATRINFFPGFPLEVSRLK